MEAIGPETDEFSRAIAALYPHLLRYARRIARNGADAEDLVHDAIERGLRRRALLRTGPPGPWMMTILRHLFLDGCRRDKRWRTIGPAWRRMQLAEAEGDVWRSDDPEHGTRPLASDGFTSDDIRRAARSLPATLRDVFHLFVFGCVPQREIGRRLALPVSTVGTRILRARRKLRDLLETGAPAAQKRARRTARAALAA